MHGPCLPRRFSVLAVLLVIGMTGCSSFSPLGNKPVPTSPPATDSSRNYRVEMHFFRGDTKIFDGQLGDGTSGAPVTVQSALEASGAIGKYKNMEITVYRRVAETGHGLKMPVTYEPKTDSVKVEQDYALHPSDRIVIQPISKGLMTYVLDGMTGSSY